MSAAPLPVRKRTAAQMRDMSEDDRTLALVYGILSGEVVDARKQFAARRAEAQIAEECA